MASHRTQATPRAETRRQSAAVGTAPAPDRKEADRSEDLAARILIVGVGASAGGLEAFTLLLKDVPVDTGMGFVLVQHLDPVHESALTQILAKATAMPVREAANNLPVEPNHVYIIPPNRNMTIAQGRLKLAPRRQTAGAHRSIDVFFESLAQDQRERAIGVILSGTASDGTLGLEAIKAEGGLTLAQDESAKYDSMPRSAIAAGCVDLVLSPEQIARELARIARHPDVLSGARSPAAEGAEAQDETEASDTPLPARGQRFRRAGEEDGLKNTLLLLRDHSGVDFSLYNPSTLQRRINRRMVLNKITELQAYADFLRGNAKELRALYADMLISVTGFFRNPEAFETLKRKVFPKLLKRQRGDPLRCWVLGCSTGQEAYSIAMAFIECAEGVARLRKLQVFATDLNDQLLDKARHGLYAKNLVQDVAPERLRRFFLDEEGGYRVIKSIREMCVFARHNVLSDPPFSRMDLIACRNLLIYLEPSTQRKILPAFHYALKPEGFLFLGVSESIGEFANLFEPIDKKLKIYSKKAGLTPAFHLPVFRDHPEKSTERPAAAKAAPPEGYHTELNAQREADRVTINHYAPPGVLINADLEILQFRGPTDPYLQPPKGKASFDVLKMAREGLMLPLRAAITKAKKQNAAVRREGVQINQNGHNRTVNIEVTPLKNVKEQCYLIVFEPAERRGLPLDKLPKPGSRAGTAVETRGQAARDPAARRIAELEAELAETRDYFQVLQEQHDAANEELQAFSEELQSANEELQSINEELETSKEELESTNEELNTVNEEVARNNVELNRLNSDLKNFHLSLNQAIVLLGRDLTIRRFTPPAERTFNLLASDVGRLLSGTKHNLDYPDLEQLITEVIHTVSAREREVRDKAGRWYSLRVRPYLTLDNKIDGALLMLVDIDALKRSEQDIKTARDHAEAILRTAPDPLLVLHADLKVNTANEAFYKTFKVIPVATEGRLIYELGDGQWNIPKLRELLEDVLPRNNSFDNFEITHDFATIGRRTMLLNARKLRGLSEGVSERILLGIQDITDRKRAGLLKEADRRKDEFLGMLAHELRTPLSAISNVAEILRQQRTSDPETTRLQSMLTRQTRTLTRMVDDLLDISRITSGKIRLEKELIALSPVISRAVESTRSLMESRRHELIVSEPDAPLRIEADATRLEQILVNLLSNAAKYTDPGGRIHLMAKQENEGVCLIVRDNGIGISAEMLSRVFEMFAQVDQSLERTQGGLGIGLALVRSLVELHGGTVQVTSAGVGQGSEFIVRLPLGTMPQQDQGATGVAPVQPTIGSARRILVVEDNQDAAESLVTLIELMGHEVRSVHDGASALETAAAFRPDVVLLDIGLPDINGYEVAPRLRQQPGLERIALAALTGWGQEEDRLRARTAGFDRHFVKPIDVDGLRAWLASLPA